MFSSSPPTPSTAPPSGLTVALLAKSAIPGAVKTRLCPPLEPTQAAQLHQAMVHCLLDRLPRAFETSSRFLLALETSRRSPANLKIVAPPPWRIIDQGAGDLGDRLDGVWKQAGTGPLVLLGADSPDIPHHLLGQIAPALLEADAALGPCPDGGYWTLAAGRYLPHLIQNIDWGGPNVYHQTLQHAAGAGCRLLELPSWYDVDRYEDLVQLLERLGPGDEPPLVDLRHQMLTICKDLL